MSAPDRKKKPAIEAALGACCANVQETLSAHEKKICYFVDTIKRDVAQPFSLGMPADKLCQRISTQNSEICSVKFPVKTEKLEQKVSATRATHPIIFIVLCFTYHSRDLT